MRSHPFFQYDRGDPVVERCFCKRSHCNEPKLLPARTTKAPTIDTTKEEIEATRETIVTTSKILVTDPDDDEHESDPEDVSKATNHASGTSQHEDDGEKASKEKKHCKYRKRKQVKEKKANSSEGLVVWKLLSDFCLFVCTLIVFACM